MPLRSENTPSLACVSIIATTSICCAPLFWLHIALHFNFSYGWSGVRNGAGCTVWKSFETINKITKIIWFIWINGQFKKTRKITIQWIALSGLCTTSPPGVVPYRLLSLCWVARLVSCQVARFVLGQVYCKSDELSGTFSWSEVCAWIIWCGFCILPFACHRGKLVGSWPNSKVFIGFTTKFCVL